MSEIPQDIIKNWQDITDLVGEFCKVPACLIMKGNPESMEVFISSSTPQNPYLVGETAPRNNELYCETVIRKQAPLQVIDARVEKEWSNNPDIELGMISYYGLPINWPDGQNFGTFCILDTSPKEPALLEKRFINKFASVLEDQLKLFKLKEQYEYEATHDALTGIYNRRIFFEMAKREISSAFRNNNTLALIELDVDKFKNINDTFGHPKGDLVLKELTKLIAACLREGDIFSRLGGEEFVILGYIHEEKGIDALAEKIRYEVESSRDIFNLIKTNTTISLGATTLKEGDDIDSLLKRADLALYKAKSDGRNCFRII